MTYTILRTMRFIFVASVFLIGFFAFSTPHADAYFTTAQKEIDLGNGSALFLIEYAFGTEKYNVHMPIIAQSGTETDDEKVSYQILDRDGNNAPGTTTGIVLSSANIDANNEYVVTKGMSKKFLLAVFFTPTPESTEKKYRLQVTHIPFTFDGAQQLQLNPSELKYYTTQLLRI